MNPNLQLFREDGSRHGGRKKWSGNGVQVLNRVLWNQGDLDSERRLRWGQFARKRVEESYEIGRAHV